MGFKNLVANSIFLVILLWMMSCGEVVFVDTTAPPQTKEDSIAQAVKDAGLIAEYINRKGFKQVLTTPTGIRYALTNPGNGIFPELNDIVSINYVMRFLNDSIIDSNVEQIAKGVPIAKENFSYVPIVFNHTLDGSSINYQGVYGYLSLMPGLKGGIAAAMGLMDEGSTATIILPSIQAMGLNGYRLTSGFNIPANEVLVIEITLVRVRKFS